MLQKRAVPTDKAVTSVKFPRGQFARFVEGLPAETYKRFPALTPDRAAVLRVFLKDAKITVEGFYKPFANSQHVSEDWLLRYGPIVENVSLLNILQQDRFTFVIPLPAKVIVGQWNESLLPPPAKLPYGQVHSWSLSRYETQMQNIKGLQFEPSWTFEDDNDHLTALSQCQAQDVMWIDNFRREILAARCFAYFIPQDPSATGVVTRYYAVLALEKDLKARNRPAWRRLSKDGDVDLLLFLDDFDGPEDKADGCWNAKIINHPNTIDVIKSQHPVEKHEVVLAVSRPSKHGKGRGADIEVSTFENRSVADQAMKQGDNQ